MALFVSRRPIVLALSLASFGSHLLVDYLTAPWEMAPFRPLSGMLVNVGRHLPKWLVQYVFQFTALSGMFACTVWIYFCYGRTPLEIISPRLDRLVLGYVALPWKHRCRECGARAHFRCEECEASCCGRHWRARGLGGRCESCARKASAHAAG